MAEVLALVREQRRRLLAREAQTTQRLVRDWRAIEQMLEREQRALVARMDAELRAGGVIRPSWLHAYGRLDELAAQLRQQIEQYARAVAPTISEHVVDAAELGARSASTIASSAGLQGGELIAATLQPRAVERVVALTARAAPVQRVLIDAGGDAAGMLRAELLRGVSIGENPRAIARRMTRVADVPLARARTIARTEAMRAYRGSQIETWAQLPTAGWVWVSAADARTCAACFAMHGTEHPAGSELESHPNCRCVPAPLVPGSRVVERTGAELLRAMPAEQLVRKLGRAKANALRGGRIVPADLVDVRSSPIWGTTRTEATLRRALANAATRRASTL